MQSLETIDIPFTLEENIKVYEDGIAIKAPSKGRISFLMMTGPAFLYPLYVLVSILYEVCRGFREPDLLGIGVIAAMVIMFGNFFISHIHGLITMAEVLLLPDQRTIVLRREQTRQILSEHSIDDIEVRLEKAYHEDPSRTPMRWFTLFDANRQKQIFAVRTAGDCGEMYDTAELKEFFYQVMGKKGQQ